MAETGPFRTVLRGYDPAQVDQHVAGLLAVVAEARSGQAELSTRVQALERRLTERAAEDAEELVRPDALQPTHAALGHRVQQILALSEEEAQDVLDRAQADAGALRAEADAHARLVRTEADRYDESVRADASAEGQRLLAEAQARAEEVVDAAERRAAVLDQEAQATWEEARSRAAQAAADFEIALATRRHRTEVEAEERARARAEELDQAQRLVAQARDRADAVDEESARRSEELLVDAREEAARLLAEAREQAEAVRAASQRELAAATARRDSINAQLSHVRQMLATLSGGAGAPAGALPVTGLGDVDGADAPEDSFDLDAEDDSGDAGVQEGQRARSASLPARVVESRGTGPRGGRGEQVDDWTLVDLRAPGAGGSPRS